VVYRGDKTLDTPTSKREWLDTSGGAFERRRRREQISHAKGDVLLNLLKKEFENSGHISEEKHQGKALCAFVLFHLCA